tara:strand:+ start:591 stop:1082 length:492 start_codon:yes stop_codon:yes gene_type:complete
MAQSIRSFEALPRVLSEWKHVIQKGNRAFAAHDMAQALVAYQAALQLASAMVGSHPDWGRGISVAQADDAIVALVVSRHNLADFYINSELSERAAEHLCQAHEAVYGLLSHPDADVTQLALQHLHVTSMELMAFIKRFGGSQRTNQTLQSAQLANSPLAVRMH